MTSFGAVISVAFLYGAALFAVAFIAERLANSKRGFLTNSTLVYTLSLSVYCTAWTFYGAVGSAARNGFEFLTIYLGPTLVFIGWWWCLRHLVRIGRTEKLTSIADFVSARYGKSISLGAIVTMIALIGTTPYIALQLQSLTLSFTVFAQLTPSESTSVIENNIALTMTVGLAIFIAIFGTRRINASERHEGVVMAVAIEAIVKLIALVSIGVMVVFWINSSSEPLITPELLTAFDETSFFSSRWAVLIFLSAFAIITLPRMFQVMVVENQNEKQLALASWAFPTYLLIMCLFVMPIALFGLSTLGPGANPDLFVLTIPLSQGYDKLALLAFLGGFSSATSMVIMAALALATMISNHLILPLMLALQPSQSKSRQDLRGITLMVRRVSIFFVLGLGYIYYRISGGSDALASIGLIAFLGVSQIIPPLIGGIFWRSATKSGAIAGVVSGFIIWTYTLFLPSFGSGFIMDQEIFNTGLFGIWLLKPYALMGTSFSDPLVHAFVWSLGINIVVFILVSLTTSQNDIEKFQALIFQPEDVTKPRRPLSSHSISAHDLLFLAQRILGRKDGQAFFERAAKEQNKSNKIPEITVEFIEQLERELAAVLGAATSQAILNQFVGRDEVSTSGLMAIADEQAAIRNYSIQLEAKSNELEDTANKLRDANMRLVHLGQQRDHFLSSVSHELRTPMTSIRSFSEILKTKLKDRDDKSNYFAEIIHDESLRLTRLLDEILNLSFLESGQTKTNMSDIALSNLIRRAIIAANALIENRNVAIQTPDQDFTFISDEDRLVQAVINLITNGIKHNPSENPKIWIDAGVNKGTNSIYISVRDNGPGIPEHDKDNIFDKFKTTNAQQNVGVGLGLPISAQIIKILGGQITVTSSDEGSVFTITMPIDGQSG